MRHAMQALAFATFAVAVAPRAAAQSEYQKAVQLYQQGTKQTLAELGAAAGWAGRTLIPDGGVFGGALLLYPSNDPIGGAQTYCLERVVQNPDGFLIMTADDMTAYYDEQEAYITSQGYTGLIDSNDPLNNELSYTSGNGLTRYGVRKAVSTGGVPMYMVSATCENFRGCRLIGSGRIVGPGSNLGIVYVWENKMVPPPAQ